MVSGARATGVDGDDRGCGGSGSVVDRGDRAADRGDMGFRARGGVRTP